MDKVWATGRRHVKTSKLYLKALLRRGPNIFVALAWSQVFWLVLEAAAGNESSHGYVRLSSVACYALALHTGGHLLLYRCAGRNWSHHALEFLLDLVTDVVGFAWINLAEETLAQVFFVTAKNAFTYAVLACAASLGAMEIGSCIRSLLDWPPDVDDTANQFDAGSFALPTSWLVTQAVHIALYGFFYRTRAESGQGGRGTENEEVDVRLAASLFLLAYAVLCSMVAARVIGGTIAAATVAGGAPPDEVIGGGAESDSRQSDLVLRAVEAGGPFTAALASDAARSSPPRGDRSRADGDGHGGAGGAASRRAAPAGSGGSTLLPPSEKEDEEEEGEAGGGGGLSRKVRRRDGPGDEEGGGHGEASLVTASLVAAAVAAAEASRARRDSLRRGIKAYMRLTVGMMVGWAYNLWGQVEFRQEELEFRFGPALGATVYASLSTALGVCIMVRGADKLDGSGNDRAARRRALGDRGLSDDCADPSEEDGGQGQGYEDAVRAFHARRMLVVVGGVGLMTGWAWEEAIDLMLEALVGDSTDAGMIAAKLALAVVSTAVVLGREMRAEHHHDDGGGAGGGRHHHQDVGDRLSGVVGEVGNELSEPLMATRGRDGIQ